MYKNKLFNAIIKQAIEDLFDKDLDIKADAIAWIMDNELVKTDNSKVTFLDCCDLTSRTPHQLRRLLPIIISGQITKAKTLEYFDV